MFIIMVWATFLARVKPVSTSAKPACMKKTRKPASNTHITFTLSYRVAGGAVECFQVRGRGVGIHHTGNG